MAKIKHLTGSLTTAQVISGNSSTTWKLDAGASITTDSSITAALTDKNAETSAIATGQRIVIAGSIDSAKTGIALNGTHLLEIQSGGIVDGTNFGVYFTTTSGGSTFNNSGDVLSTGTALYVAADIDITNAASGDINGGNYGVYSSVTDLSLSNLGVIESSKNAVYLSGTGATLTNSGRIESDFYALQILGAGSTVNNKAGATIDGSGLPVWFGNTSGKTIFNNAGSVIGNSYNSISGDDGVTVITNSGKIVGSIYLGGGNDVFRNAGGTVKGTIDLEAGSDTYFVDKTSLVVRESSVGDAGDIDTVKASVTFTLGTNIENIVLTGKGNIRAIGNSADNELTGNAGDNRLTGKGGADIFHFSTGGGHDTIADFAHLTDDIDLSGWKAITSFNDLKNNHLTFTEDGALIRAGTDHLLLVGIEKGELSSGDFLF